MKQRRIFITFLLIFAIGLLTANARKKTTLFPIRCGTNIAHWLSQGNSRGCERDTFFTSLDIDRIAAMGFDHIRLPIDEEQMFRPDGSKDPKAFALLQGAILHSVAKGLRVVVDLHILRSHYFNGKSNTLFSDPKAGQRFVEIWQCLSRELRHYSIDSVAYELMNEPVADIPSDWNRVYLPVYRAIRKNEPKRVIVIGSNRWQAFDQMKYLEIPKGDRNIILSFHYYNPLAFTHCRASWNDLKDCPVPSHYPGNPVTLDDLKGADEKIRKKYNWWTLPEQSYDRRKIAEDMRQASDFAQSKGLRVYCGEYGALHTTPSADRLRWYNDVTAVMDSLGIARANWCYKEDGFGLVNIQGRETDSRITAVAAGKKQ